VKPDEAEAAAIIFAGAEAVTPNCADHVTRHVNYAALHKKK
jgi:hypothetical protein